MATKYLLPKDLQPQKLGTYLQLYTARKQNPMLTAEQAEAILNSQRDASASGDMAATLKILQTLQAQKNQKPQDTNLDWVDGDLPRPGHPAPVAAQTATQSATQSAAQPATAELTQAAMPTKAELAPTASNAAAAEAQKQDPAQTAYRAKVDEIMQQLQQAQSDGNNDAVMALTQELVLLQKAQALQLQSSSSPLSSADAARAPASQPATQQAVPSGKSAVAR